MIVTHEKPAGWVDTDEADKIQPSQVADLVHIVALESEDVDLLRGPQGLPGADGAAGLQGPQGVPGADGSDAFLNRYVVSGVKNTALADIPKASLTFRQQKSAAGVVNVVGQLTLASAATGGVRFKNADLMIPSFESRIPMFGPDTTVRLLKWDAAAVAWIVCSNVGAVLASVPLGTYHFQGCFWGDGF